ncbi:MAG: c-type cytochrome [Gammaproteobacteria bacterium]
MRSSRIVSLLGILGIYVLTVFLLPGCDRGDTTAQSGKTPAIAHEAATEKIQHGKQLADERCLKCHRADGDIVERDYPQINGQKAEYIDHTLGAYTTGKRRHEEMRKVLLGLDEADFQNLAAYYSSLDTPWKRVLLPARQRHSGPDPKAIKAGKKLAQPCLSCHGENGNSPTEGIPSLAGLSQEYIVNAFEGYFHGQRKNDIMEVFKHAFDKNKVTKLAAYFASEPRQPQSLPVKGNPKTGERLAQQHCTGCHGPQGNSYIDRFPTLAGQNAKYLYQATLAYRNNTRHNALMKQAISGLSKQNIKNLAAYFATQKPRATQPHSAKQGDDPMQIARAAARPCFGCHAEDGNSTMSGTPSLSGLKPAYLSNAMEQYKDGGRKHDLMKSFVTSLQKQDMDLIAAYFAAQKPKATTNKGNGDPAKATDVISGCEGCHGEKGISTSNVPSLAGQDADYIVKALTEYQNQQRSSDDMKNALSEVDKAAFKHLATYFARQQPVKPDVPPLQTAEQLSIKCNRCHAIENPEINQIAPRIAGQSEPYLLKALYEYKSKIREQSTMFAMLDVLNDWEIRNLARYYARLNSADK